MYTPPAFRLEERDALTAFIRENSFGILFSETEQGPYATHLPFSLIQGNDGFGTLVGHMARANPHWRLINPSREVLVVFHGPHTYISPTYYQTAGTVPTWNYIAVHVYGTFEEITDRADLRSLLDEQVRSYEVGRTPQWETHQSEETVQQLLGAIVGFRIHVTRVEGKSKMSQNRPTDVQERVAGALSKSSDPQDQAVAALMQENIRKERG